MSTQSILEWVVCVTSNLLPSQSRTLAALVAAAIRTERPNLATIGRRWPARPPPRRHQAGLAVHLTTRRVEVHRRHGRRHRPLCRKRKKRLLVSFDWTEVRDFHSLMAAACIGGRAVPLLWASYPECG